jgi:hypothetical protein
MNWRSRIEKTVRQVRDAWCSLTPVEAVEILVLILWAIFVLSHFRVCGLSRSR